MTANVLPLTFDSFFKVYSYDFFETQEVKATLSEENQLYARVGRVALAFFTFGVAPLVCWLKWGDQQIRFLCPKLTPIQEAVYRIKHITTNPFFSFFNKETVLSGLFNTLNEEELNQVLTTVIEEIFTQGNEEKGIDIFDKLATLIPLSRIEKMYSKEEANQKAKAILEDAKKQFKDAKRYLQKDEKDVLSLLSVRFSALLDALVAAIEGVISTLGLQDMFKPAESAIHADFKSQKLMILLNIFSIMITVVLPLTGATSGAAIIGGVFLGIIALGLIWPWIKPIPSYLPNAENWTKEIKEGARVPQGKKRSLEEIASILKKGRHAMLVGPSRTGKSLTAKAFAQAVEKGKWPELKGKKVFRINMADIVDQAPSLLGGGNSVLNEMSDVMGRHRDNIILVFDEIHNACKGYGQMAEKMKPFLDEGGLFPHVIGITTDKEYQEYVQEHDAFSQRFDKVAIESTTRKETIKILAKRALRHPLKPIIELGALGEIETETSKKPQPFYAMHLLEDCINRIGKNWISPTEEQIELTDREIEAVEWERVACHGEKQKNDQTEGFKTYKKGLLETLQKERSAKERLLAIKKAYDLAIKRSYQYVLALSSSEISYEKKERSLKCLTMLQNWVAPRLKKKIKEEASAQGIPLVIDRDFVRKVSQGENGEEKQTQ